MKDCIDYGVTYSLELETFGLYKITERRDCQETETYTGISATTYYTNQSENNYIKTHNYNNMKQTDG